MGAKVVKTLSNAFLTVGIVALFLACGPTCPEIKGALDEEAIIGEDVARVNALVEKRKAAIAEAKSGQIETFPLQRLKFSVTAWEMAVWVQARIIKISPRFEDSPKYVEYASIINKIRCYLDKLVADPEHTVSDVTGKKLQAHKTRIDTLFRREGTITKSEFASYLEEGIVSEN